MNSLPAASPAIELRLLNENDVEQYCRLRLEALECEPMAFSESPAEHHQLTKAQQMARLRQGPENPSFVVGAFADGRLVGMAGFKRQVREKMRHKGHIFGVYVGAEYRGRSIARELMNDLLRRARNIAGLEQVDLAVAERQTAAKKLYESLGFQVYGREPRALRVASECIDEEFMVLALRD
jgi:ribosomal protein S18 acetylase RimI-like enzyme